MKRGGEKNWELTNQLFEFTNMLTNIGWLVCSGSVKPRLRTCGLPLKFCHILNLLKMSNHIQASSVTDCQITQQSLCLSHSQKRTTLDITLTVKLSS